MKAITIKQPWASLIVEGIKDIENRTWKTNFRGRVLIHAGMARQRSMQLLLTTEQLIEKGKRLDMYKTDFDVSFPKGVIIGSVEIVDCVINHPSIWAEKSKLNECPDCKRKITKLKSDFHCCLDCGRILIYRVHSQKPIYNWVLANPIKFDKPIPCKGKLSFWEYSGELPL